MQTTHTSIARASTLYQANSSKNRPSNRCRFYIVSHVPLYYVKSELWLNAEGAWRMFIDGVIGSILILCSSRIYKQGTPEYRLCISAIFER